MSKSSVSSARVDRIPQPLEVAPSVPAGGHTITEGAAVILYAGKDAVFYNHVQIFNRDLTLTAVRCYDKVRRDRAQPRDLRKAWQRRQILRGLFAHQQSQASSPSPGLAASSSSGAPRLFPSPPYPLMVRWMPGGSNAAAGQPVVTALPDEELPPELPGLRVLEALSASGLRSIRYAREVPGLDHVVCNDLDPAAVVSISSNVAFNGIDSTLGKVQPSQADATLLMYLCREPHLAFDVIDLDPYGTAVPFLDGAVQAIAEGGLLAVTCTDMAVLASQQHPDVCHSKYGCQPVKARHCHEQALRIVLASVEAAANRYGRTVTPLLSVSVDFYVRLFMTVTSSAEGANSSATRLSHLLQCTGCDSFWTVPKGGHGKTTSTVASQQESSAAPAAASVTSTAGSERTHSELGVPDAKRARVAVDEGESSSSSSSSSSSLSSRGDRVGTDERNDGAASYKHQQKQKQQKPPKRIVHASPVPCEPGSECPHCGSPVQLGGPIWSGPIHDPAFASAVFDEAVRAFGTDGRGIAGATAVPDRYYDLHTQEEGGLHSGRTVPRPSHDAGSNDLETVATSRRRLQGVLRCVTTELADAPLYYELSTLASRVRAVCPPLAPAMAALMHAGYRVSGSHVMSGALKTDAPPGALWGMMAAWQALQQPQPKGASQGTSGAGGACLPSAAEGAAAAEAAAVRAPSIGQALLSSGAAWCRAHPPWDFSVSPHVEAELARQRGDGPRYVPNPGVAWGPGSRASAAKAESKKTAGAAVVSA